MEKNDTFLKNTAALIGRVLISIIFIVAGIQKIIGYHSITALLVDKGVTSAHWMVGLSIILELLGGALVFLGLFTRLGAFLLFIFVLTGTFLFHPFLSIRWEEMTHQSYYLLKHLFALGSLLYLMGFGAGRFSLDVFRHKSR